ncbi:MAG TPA: type II toxin-antitoxin system HicA family toxin [Pirellulales bacterium]|jgi:predicted RNA binding protein YcfA (HicA-like mRNA interferase family)|nr:type II toxin-antitoxin system HicA family toxin [Pirellulales bacterium]
MASNRRFAEVKKMLERAGYTLARVRGSHHAFTKPNHPIIVIPVHRGKVKAIYVRQIEKLGEGE